MGTGPKPLNVQRSLWLRDPERDLYLGEIRTTCWERLVHDGSLIALVGKEPHGWHLSVSHEPRRRPRLGRYPTWDEIAHARYELLPNDITVAIILPPSEHYVAFHPTCFHLHEIEHG